MASFAASATIGSSAWTGLVGTGPVGWAAGAGLMVLGGIIDSKLTSKLFGGSRNDRSQVPQLLGLPVNEQQTSDPRIWAIGRRVRVPIHVIWQSDKRIAQSGGGGGMKSSAALSNNVYLDCAFAVNDRPTLRIVQVTGQGKLLTYTTRNLNDVTTSSITVSDSGGNLILAMDSVADPDWTSKFVADDVVQLEGFAPASGTLDVNVGYWRVASLTGHTSTPSSMTLAPVSGQTVASVNSTAGTPEAPAKVTRIDDAIVHYDYDTIDGTDVNGGDPTATGLDYYRIRLAASSSPTHPTPDKVFAPGDTVRLSGFTPAALNVKFEVERTSGVVLWLVRPTPLNAIPWNSAPFTAGTSTNNGVVAFDTARLFPDGLFPATFVPSDHYHYGSATQAADATIEAAEGVGNVPGYRGIAYQVFPDFNVTIFGGSVPPQMTALAEPDPSMTWGQAVAAICERHGLAQPFVDVEGVNAVPFEGGFLRGASTGVQALQPVMVAQQIVTQERDVTLAFFHIDNADAVQIRNGSAYSDFISPDGVDAKIAYEDAVDADLPTYIKVLHQDPDVQYTDGSQFYGVRNPSASDAENRQEVNLSNLVLTRKQAANLAGTLMRRAYINSRQVRMQLPANYLHVLENDLLTVTDDSGNNLTVRVIRRDVGANFQVQVTAVVEEVDLDVVGSPVQSEAGNVNRPAVRLAPVVGRVLDVPPIRDDDAFAPGLVLCGGPVGGGAWAGCSVYRSSNAGGDWTLVGTLSYQATVGRTTAIFPAGTAAEALDDPAPTWDTVSELEVEIDSTGYTFPLVTATDAAVLGGINWFALKHPDGTYEIVGARDVVQNSSTSYTLSYLLRGIRGTYRQAGDDLNVGAEVTGISFLPNTDGMFHDVSGLSNRTTLEFRFVPPGYDVTDVASVSISAAWHNCRPFSVRDIEKTINGSNDVRFTVENWTRTNVPIAQVGPYPMDETYEAYRFDLYDPTGTGLRYSRTISAEGTGSPTLRDKWVEFTSAEITLAGYTPGPSETFWIDVVQIGDYGDSPSVLQEL